MTAVHPEAHSATAPRALDHVALRVADVDAMAGFLSDHLQMGVAGRSDGSAIVGAEGKSGKLLLIPADGPVEPGALERVVFRVADLERAVGSLPKGIAVRRPVSELATFDGPEGLGLGLTQAFGGTDYDIDYVGLNVAAPDEVGLALAELGLVFRGGVLHVADKQVRLEQRPVPRGERPVLGHIAVLVESVEAVEAQVRQRGLDIDPAGATEATLAVFVPGPERIRLEFVERATRSS